MDELDLDYIRNSSFSWALWKVLDTVSARYFSGSTAPAADAAGSSASQNAAVAALAGADRAALARACVELKDLDSPLVAALAQVFALRSDAEGMAQCAQEQAQLLNREEGLVLLAVLAYAANT